MHSKIKHIEVTHPFIRGHITKGDCIIEYVNTNDHLTYIFTKPFPRDKFYEIRRSFRIIDESSVNLFVFDKVLNSMIVFH